MSSLLFLSCGSDSDGSGDSDSLASQAREALSGNLDSAGVKIVDDVDTSVVPSCPIGGAQAIAASVADSLGWLEPTVGEAKYTWSAAYAGISCAFDSGGEMIEIQSFLWSDSMDGRHLHLSDNPETEEFEDGVSFVDTDAFLNIGYDEKRFSAIVRLAPDVTNASSLDPSALSGKLLEAVAGLGATGEVASSADQECAVIEGGTGYEQVETVAALKLSNQDRIDDVRSTCGAALDEIAWMAPLDTEAVDTDASSGPPDATIDCNGDSMSFTLNSFYLGPDWTEATLAVTVLVDGTAYSTEYFPGVTLGSVQNATILADAASCGITLDYAIRTG